MTVETRPARVHLVHGGPARRCTCCLIWEDDPSGELVDTGSGLCTACQPCPECGQTGTACYDGANRTYCLTPQGDR